MNPTPGPAAPKPRFHLELGGAPLEAHYDFFAKTAVLILADGHSCDMQACINMFSALDPNVSAIVTFSGITQDAIFTRNGQRWEAEKSRKR